MSDDRNPEAASVAHPAPTIDTISVDEPSVQKWLDLPVNTPLVLNLARSDVDELFAALRRQQDSVMALQAAVLSLSNGDKAGANDVFWKSRDLNIEGMNHLSKFIRAIMSGAEIVHG